MAPKYSKDFHANTEAEQRREAEQDLRDSWMAGAEEGSFFGGMSPEEEVKDARKKLAELQKEVKEASPQDAKATEKPFEETDKNLEPLQSSAPEVGEFVDVPLDNPSSLQKAPPSLYLKAMDVLIKRCDSLGLTTPSKYLQAVKFKEEFVLPTIDQLVKDYKKDGKLSEQQIKNTFEDLLTREDNADVDLNQKEVKDKIKAMSELELPKDKKQARREVLQAFADVSALKGEGDLAKTCKWSAMKSARERAQNIGKKVAKNLAKATGRKQNGLTRGPKRTGEISL